MSAVEQISTTPPSSTGDRTQHCRPSRFGWLGHFGCVLCRTEFRAPLIVRPLPEPLESGLRRMPLMYGFVVEIHSFLHRMALRSRLRYRAYYLYVGRLEQESGGHLEPNKRTHACIRDIRSFAQRHPWATHLDLEMYRNAWLAGVQYAESNYCKSKQETDRSAAQSTSDSVIMGA